MSRPTNIILSIDFDNTFLLLPDFTRRGHKKIEYNQKIVALMLFCSGSGIPIGFNTSRKQLEVVQCLIMQLAVLQNDNTQNGSEYSSENLKKALINEAVRYLSDLGISLNFIWGFYSPHNNNYYQEFLHTIEKAVSDKLESVKGDLLGQLTNMKTEYEDKEIIIEQDGYQQENSGKRLQILLLPKAINASEATQYHIVHLDDQQTVIDTLNHLSTKDTKVESICPILVSKNNDYFKQSSEFLGLQKAAMMLLSDKELPTQCSPNKILGMLLYLHHQQNILADNQRITLNTLIQTFKQSRYFSQLTDQGRLLVDDSLKPIQLQRPGIRATDECSPLLARGRSSCFAGLFSRYSRRESNTPSQTSNVSLSKCCFGSSHSSE